MHQKKADYRGNLKFIQLSKKALSANNKTNKNTNITALTSMTSKEKHTFQKISQEVF